MLEELKLYDLPELDTNSPLDYVETEELKCGDFVIVVMPKRVASRRNAVFGRVTSIFEVGKPISSKKEDEKEIVFTLKHGGYEETLGPIDTKSKEGYLFFRCDIVKMANESWEDCDICPCQLTKLTKK